MEGNLLIVEDDEIQRRNLKLMLQELDEKFNIFEAANIKDAIIIMSDNDIDLFYLDQNLPDGLGIELGKKIRTINKYKLTWIIFLTNHVQYMLEAFKEIHCYDYLLKPYSKEEIKNLTLELMHSIAKNKVDPVNTEKPSIDFNVNGIKLKLYLDQIYFIEVSLRTCFIHTKLGMYKVEKTPLSRIIERLPNENFVQSHRAFIVNSDYINKLYEYKGSWVLSFIDYEQTALIGRTFKENLLKLIEKKNINIYDYEINIQIKS